MRPRMTANEKNGSKCKAKKIGENFFIDFECVNGEYTKVEGNMILNKYCKVCVGKWQYVVIELFYKAKVRSMFYL